MCIIFNMFFFCVLNSIFFKFVCRGFERNFKAKIISNFALPLMRDNFSLAGSGSKWFHKPIRTKYGFCRKLLQLTQFFNFIEFYYSVVCIVLHAGFGYISNSSRIRLSNKLGSRSESPL